MNFYLIMFFEKQNKVYNRYKMQQVSTVSGISDYLWCANVA